MTTASSTSTTVSPSRVAAPSARLLSLDVLRGLTIAFMILVNNNGNEAVAYGPLKHSAWNGFTPTYLVFPTFLFLVGITTVFSTASRLAKGDTKQSLFLHVLRRSIILYLLGLVVNSFPFFHLHTMRFYECSPASPSATSSQPRSTSSAQAGATRSRSPSQRWSAIGF